MVADNYGDRELTQSTMDFLKEKWRSAAWSAVVIAVLTAVCVIIHQFLIAAGLLAGWIISLINYILLAATVDYVVKRFRRTGNKFSATLLTVGGYHGRFWGLIILIYFAFQLYGAYFVLAFIAGMSLLKWVTVCEAIDRAFDDDFGG